MATHDPEVTPQATRHWRGAVHTKENPVSSLAITDSAAAAAAAHLASSSVSSPSAHDADCAEVDELLEGIDRVRIDDLWTTPRSAQPSPGAAPFREGLFAPPPGSGIAAIATAKPTGLRSKPLRDILDAAAVGNANNVHAGQPPKQPPFKPAGLRSKPLRDILDAAAAAQNQPPAYTRTLSAPAVHSPAIPRRGHVTCDHDEHDHTCSHGHSIRPSSPANGFVRANSVAVPRAGALQHPSALADPEKDFPALFKVYPCPTAAECYARGDHSECFYYHALETDRRRLNVGAYRPHMCRFIEEAGGCRKGDRCPFAHNDFERRYHPDRFGKETCRDFLRGDCPRRYCTFRHEVSTKVEISIAQIDAMTDKEVLQLVLKISEAKGRALSEKLVRRFGHGKKHSGWRLEGFNPRGRDDQKVKYVTARVEEVKRTLRAAGERKWAASLKTTSLRDMMSGVRKVAEEIRERHYKTDEAKAESGPEMQRLIRAVFSNTNWSCHSQEGDNPFIVTPENQNDALTALERLVGQALGLAQQTHLREQAFGMGEVGMNVTAPATAGGASLWR